MAQRGALVLLTVRRAFIGRMFKTAPTHDSHALSIGEGNMTSQIKNEKKLFKFKKNAGNVVNYSDVFVFCK